MYSFIYPPFEASFHVIDLESVEVDLILWWLFQISRRWGYWFLMLLGDLHWLFLLAGKECKHPS